ncbi:MAG: EAL domain-containing protein [Solirubrobacteraceae bacterium]
MSASGQPSPQDPGWAALERLCALALERLEAERVVVWRYSAWARLVSPVAGRRRQQSGPSVPSWWARRSIEEVEPFESCLQDRRTVAVSREELREVAWQLAEDLAGDSISCVPLLLRSQPLGMITVEPVPSGEAAAALSELSACAAPLLAWQAAEQGRTQAELLLEVIEAAGAQSGSISELLYTVCARLARELGVNRTSVFLHVGDRLVPRMATFTDGRKDTDAWLRFRHAQELPPMVEAAFASGKPVRATHRQDPKLGEWWADGFGIQSAMAVPLGSPPLGVLVLDSSAPRSFRNDEIRVTTAFGSLVGEIVRRTQQAADREARLAAGESVRELLKDGLASPDVAHMAGRLASIARQALDAEVASVCVPAGGGTLHEAGRAASDPALCERSSETIELPAREESTSVVADVEADDDAGACGRLIQRLGLASGVVVPLVGYEDGSGVLVCGSPKPRMWSERRLELASQLGLEGGLVLEAARLRELDRARQEELQHQAHHDSLTGLANRSLFYERAGASLAVAQREDREVALLLIDLDGFKDINDGLGHDHGDRLLVEIGSRLLRAVREGDIVARLGGDEFAVALTSRVSRQSALAAARRIAAALGAPIVLGGIEVSIGASIGIALFPDHGASTEVLLRHADAAMYEAKRDHSGIELYERQAGTRETPALLVQRLRQAIADRSLVLHYQPKIDLRADRVTGAEALVRWRLPDGSYVPPADFIPLAEATGLIRKITPLVLVDALNECRRWLDQDLDLGVAVNVTTSDIGDPRFPSIVQEALKRSGVEGHRLTVEVTESSLIRNQAQVIAVLRELAELGVSVSLDDFGTGYSSLGLLDRLPVSELKIDRGFLRESDRPTTAAIVGSVVSLGHALGLQIVAEGVETAASVRNVARMGCDIAQGYHYARPLAADEFLAWVAEYGRLEEAA